LRTLSTCANSPSKTSNRLSLQHFFLVIDFNYKIWVYRGKSSGVPVTQPAGWGGKIIELKGGERSRNATIIFRLLLRATWIVR
jgi:hypothetical protein